MLDEVKHDFKQMKEFYFGLSEDIKGFIEDF